MIQIFDKTAICDRDNLVKIFVGSHHIHTLEKKCFFQKLDYYAMSKVFSTDGRRLYFVNNQDRSQLISVDMAQTAYPEKIIDSGLLNVFQTVYDSERNLLASLDEHSGEVSYLDGTNFELKEKVSLPDSAVYRTIDVHNGLTIVNSILKESEVTTSIVSFIGKDFSLKSQWRKLFAGSHLGLYFHKIKIISVEPSGLPVIGMISHHFHSP